MSKIWQKKERIVDKQQIKRWNLIKVMTNNAIIISTPGILKGRQLLGLISFGIILPEILIIKSVKYSVIPIGIKTTIPAMKLFLIEENNDFFIFCLDINYE